MTKPRRTPRNDDIRRSMSIQNDNVAADVVMSHDRVTTRLRSTVFSTCVTGVREEFGSDSETRGAAAPDRHP